MVVEKSLDSHKPVEIGDLLPLTMQERGGYQEVQSAAGSGRAGRFKKLLLGDPEGLSRPLARDGLSSGDASGGTGGISGTTDLRCPPARAGRRVRTASRQPPWVRPGLGPRYGFSALPWNSVVSPPAKQRRLVALHSWGFLRAIGPAVAKRPPARSPVLRARGSGRPARSSNSTPARPAGSSSTRVGSLDGNYRL